jgi:hypothetical protein
LSPSCFLSLIVDSYIGQSPRCLPLRMQNSARHRTKYGKDLGSLRRSCAPLGWLRVRSARGLRRSRHKHRRRPFRLLLPMAIRINAATFAGLSPSSAYLHTLRNGASPMWGIFERTFYGVALGTGEVVAWAKRTTRGVLGAAGHPGQVRNDAQDALSQAEGQ